MARIKTELPWDRDFIAKRMRYKKIQDRAQLAEGAPVARSTIYESFNADWSGYATTAMLDFISNRLDVKIDKLILDPRRSRGGRAA